jgi:chromosome segregation ATPase
MYLEQLWVEGFKSYSLETEMNFNPGIGVVMGNNGVGKSNILDAITWGLGENDLERLRCYDTKDLFFSGSKDSQAAQVARVALTLSHGPAKDDVRVHLERRLSRAGEDNYLADQKPVSRAEYRQRLEDLGLVDTLKTLIRQEQLNDWLRLDSAERLRNVLAFLGNGSAPPRVDEFVRDWDKAFKHYFTILLPEGDCRLYLDNSNGAQGLEIEIRFPDKGVKKSKLLSGGERTVTSLAAKLALFDQLQSPAYFLDEVEPSLDYVNHKRMQDFLKDLATRKQLIMITHLRSTIELANTLHGVRVRRDGSSFMKFYFVMDKRLLRLYKCC